MLKISVIIPVYNCEKYLKQCLDSILSQTFDSYEVICMDDSSNDGSSQILREYKKKYNNLRVYFNKSKMGAAISRNHGLKIANGEYVIFLDSDDFFSNNLLENTYREIKTKNADMLLFNCAKVNEQNQILEIFNCVNTDYSVYNSVFKFIDVMQNIPLCKFLTAPWNRMLRRDFLIKNKIYFQNLTSSNDAYFSDMTILLAEKIFVLNNEVPFVYYRTGTSTQISANRDAVNFYLSIVKDKEELCSRKLWEIYSFQIFWKFIYCLNSELERCTEDKQNHFWKYYSNNIWNDFCKNDLKLRDDGICVYILEEYKLYAAKSRVRNVNYDFLYKTISKIDKIIDFIDANKSKKIAIWGLGQWGKVLYFSLIRKKIFVNYYVDKNKHNLELEFYREIEIFDNLINKDVDIIIATNCYIARELKNCIEYKNIEIVILQEIMG